MFRVVLFASIAVATASSSNAQSRNIFKPAPSSTVLWYDEIGQSFMDGTYGLVWSKHLGDAEVTSKAAINGKLTTVKEGRGWTAASNQASLATEKLGKPTSFECASEQYGLFYCKFKYSQNDRGLLLFLTKKASKVDSIEFYIYDKSSETVASIAPPVFVPPPPSPLDRRLVDAFASNMIAGDSAAAAANVALNATVARTVRNPFKNETIIESEGKGSSTAASEANFLLAKMGRPKSVECEYQASFATCTFRFSPKTGMLLAALATRNGEIDLVQFIYATTQMVREMQASSGK